MRVIVLALLIVLLASTAAAQNPCTDPTAGVTLNPAKVYVAVPEFNGTEVDGSPLFTSFSYGLFAEGDDPNTAKPAQGPSSVPKTAFTPVAGAADCYVADLPAPIPTGQRLVGALKLVRAATATLPTLESPWSAPSNPFGAASTALAAPGPPTFRR